MMGIRHLEEMSLSIETSGSIISEGDRDTRLGRRDINIFVSVLDVEHQTLKNSDYLRISMETSLFCERYIKVGSRRIIILKMVMIFHSERLSIIDGAQPFPFFMLVKKLANR